MKVPVIIALLFMLQSCNFGGSGTWMNKSIPEKEKTSIKEYLISSSLAGLGGILFFLIILGNIGAGLWILSRSLNFNILITIFIYGSPFVFLGVSINTFLRWMFWKKLDKYIQRNVK